MDAVQVAAEQLRRILEDLDPTTDRETLVWIHKLLGNFRTLVETKVPELMMASMREARERLNEAQKILDEVERRQGRVHREKPYDDSLERMERDLDDDPNIAPIMAKLKPGPKGLSGGVALPLPEGEMNA